MISDQYDMDDLDHLEWPINKVAKSVDNEGKEQYVIIEQHLQSQLPFQEPIFPTLQNVKMASLVAVAIIGAVSGGGIATMTSYLTGGKTQNGKNTKSLNTQS